MTADESNPWQTLSSEVRYENPWIEVSHRDVITPAGTPGVYGVVHFKHVALAIIPVDDDGNTWLVGQYRYPLGLYSWELPEGGGDPDIDPLLGAQRELREETGIVAADWRRLTDIYLSNSVSDEHAIVYVATGLHFGDPAPEETERLAVRKVALEEAFAMCLDGRITDALSVAALFTYRYSRED